MLAFLSAIKCSSKGWLLTWTVWKGNEYHLEVFPIFFILVITLYMHIFYNGVNSDVRTKCDNKKWYLQFSCLKSYSLSQISSVFIFGEFHPYWIMFSVVWWSWSQAWEKFKAVFIKRFFPTYYWRHLVFCCFYRTPCTTSPCVHTIYHN